MGISSRVTGVDIGHYSIKAVTLTPTHHDMYSVVFCAELLVPCGIFADNHMLDYQKIVKKLKELKKTLPVFSYKVATSIPDSAVITKQLQLDSYQLSHLDIKSHVQEQLPFLSEDLSFDYIPSVEVHSSTHLGPRYQVVATRQSLIANRTSLFESAGFTPLMVNQQANSLSAVWHFLAQKMGQQHWFILEIGLTQVTLCHGGADEMSFYQTNTRYEELTDSGRPLWVEWVEQQIAMYRSGADVRRIDGIWVGGGGGCSAQLLHDLNRWLVLPTKAIPIDQLCDMRSTQLVLSSNYTAAFGMALSGLHWMRSRHALCN